METVVRVTDISFVYGSHSGRTVQALQTISFTVQRGELFCIVGPDGAGKTTLIRLLCGILTPQRGTISVVGYDVASQRSSIKPHIGYLSQRFSLYHDLTVEENINFFAEIHRVKNYQEKREELLEFTRLTKFRSRLAGALSGGMKQKLALCCTLIHSPDIILLDEPTTGVDPVSRRDFWTILLSLMKLGITIIVSTPYLDEAERCNKIALLNKGMLIRIDTPQNIRRQFPYAIVEVVCKDVRNNALKLRNVQDIQNVHIFGDRLHLYIYKKDILIQKVAQLLQRESIQYSALRFLEPSLEDVFISEIQSLNM